MTSDFTFYGRNFPYLLKKTLLYQIPIAILIAALIIFVYKSETNKNRKLIEAEELQTLNHQNEVISFTFKEIVTGLMFMSKQQELLLVLENEQYKNQFAKECLDFCRSKKMYDQVRFIDSKGMEVVRVNFNNGSPAIASDDLLQNKKKRYYFKDTFKLSENEVFISPLDLNIEHGEIELPIKPMIRFGTPVFDKDGKKQGIFLLNYLSKKLIHDYAVMHQHSLGQSMLLNSDGYWLHGPNPKEEWGFMYEDGITFQTKFPTEWAQISQQKSGQISNQNGLFTFKTIYPLVEGWTSSTGSAKSFMPSEKALNAKLYYWKTVSYIPAASFVLISRPFQNNLIALYAVFFLLTLFISFGISLASLKRSIAEKSLKKAHENLEIKVKERTAELVAANKDLEAKEKSIKDQLEKIQILRKIDLTIMSSFDIKHMLDIIMQEGTTKLELDAIAVLQLHSYSKRVTCLADMGFNSDNIRKIDLKLGEGLAGHVALKREPLYIPDLVENESGLGEKLLSFPLISDEGFKAYFALPLIARGKVVGVLELFHRSPRKQEPEWTSFLEVFAGQVAIALDSSAMFKNLQDSRDELILAYDTTIEGWSRALDYRDKETEGHSLRVTEMTLAIAQTMNLKEKEIVHIRRGALLHDIGKLGISDQILLKPGKLTEEEFAQMKKHPELSFELLSPIAFLHRSVDIPYCHHEKWDGTGYPRGLKGTQIPIAARIFAVADVWDALRSDRPYHKPWSVEKVKEYILSLSGTQFDPEIIKVFASICDKPPFV